MDLYRRGQMIEGQKLFRQISTLQEEIKALDEYEPHRLSEMIDQETLKKHRIAEKIVAMHMASDFLADCSMDLREALGKVGLADCSLFPMVNDIFRKSQDFASFVCKAEFAGLRDFIVDNDEYIDAMHEVTDGYMGEHLTLT